MYVSLVDIYKTILSIISCTGEATFHIFDYIYSRNSIGYAYLTVTLPQARDSGGSMVIHAFGGYYGLTISWMLYRPNLNQSKRLNGSVYHSDVFAMIGKKIFIFKHSILKKHKIQNLRLQPSFASGTLFLWMYWPSFNSAIAYHGDGQHRAAINTYLALAASVLTTFAISSLSAKKGKLDMVIYLTKCVVGNVCVKSTQNHERSNV